jgi:hypothetical protein
MKDSTIEDGRLHSFEIGIFVVITLLTMGRFFTETISIAPRVLNAVDLLMVPLLLPFLVMRLFSVRDGLLRGARLIFLSAGFVLVCGLSWLLNSHDVHWMGGIALPGALLAPVVFYLIILNSGISAQFPQRLLRLLFAILVINIGVGIVQAIFQWRNGSDFLTGTFGVNQNQMAFFLGVMMAFLLAKWRFLGLTISEVVILLLSGSLFLLCFFQALWIVFGISAVLGFVVFGKLSVRLVAMLVLAGIVTVGTLSLADFTYFSVADTLTFAVDNIDDLGKVELAKSLPELFGSRPWWSVLVGVGPGTFSSRAFRNIAVIPVEDGTTDVAASIMEPFYRSEVSAQFVLPYFRPGNYWHGGSHTLDAPFTSYISVVVESGILGALIIFGIYASTMKRLIYISRHDTDPFGRILATWSLVCILMLLGISVADNCLEVTRYTMLVWLSVGASTVYSMHSKSEVLRLKG